MKSFFLESFWVSELKYEIAVVVFSAVNRKSNEKKNR